MRALLGLFLLACAASAYQVTVANFITTYFQNYPTTNKLPNVDFYIGTTLIASSLGYTEMQTIDVPISLLENSTQGTGFMAGSFEIRATDPTLYQPWDAVLVSGLYLEFVAMHMNLWISRSVDLQDADRTPQFNFAWFAEFNGNGINCENTTSTAPTTEGLIVNVATGQGNNNGFGNLNINSNGVNDNAQPGGAQTHPIRVFTTDTKTGLNVNGGGRTWVSGQFKIICGYRYMWYAYGDRNHQDLFPLHVIGYESAASQLTSLGAVMMALVASILFRFA
jgi:hypothetical protein